MVGHAHAIGLGAGFQCAVRAREQPAILRYGDGMAKLPSDGEISPDDRIIQTLVNSPRLTYKAIAAAIGVPETTVRMRVRSLMRTGRISTTIMVHPSISDGAVIAFNRLCFSAEQFSETRPELVDLPWVARVVGEPSLLVEVEATGVVDLAAKVEMLRRLPGVQTIETTVLLGLTILHRSGGEVHPAWTTAESRPPDDLDSRLMDLLKKDGRATYTALSNAIGLRVAATRARVLALEAAGMIRFVTHVRDGTNIEAGLQIELNVLAPAIQAVQETLKMIESVRYVAAQTGKFNVLCYVADRDEAGHSGELDAIFALPGVLEHRAFPTAVIYDRMNGA
jgi:DNA-binding Lrp family transcriptional regulator